MEQNYEQIYAVAYKRYSSVNQKDGYSIEAQGSEINEYALKHNIIIVQEFSDEAKTGKNANRDDFKNMLDFIKENEHISLVLCHKRDRTFRNRRQMNIFLDKLEDMSVDFIAVAQDFGKGKEAVLMESMTDGLSEYYSLNLAEEVMKAMKVKARNAEHCGGRPLWGYDVTPDKKYVINEQEAHIVREAFQRYANGESLGDIIDAFNSKGYTTKRGQPFGKNSLHDTFRNERYKGVYVYNRAVGKNSKGQRNNRKEKSPDEIIRIEGGMPAIIDNDTWERVAQRRRQSQYGTYRQSSKRTYLLAGRIYCGECGYAMNGTCHTAPNGKDRMAYRCSHRWQTKLCDNGEISLPSLEAYVLEKLKIHLFTKDGMAQIAKQLNAYRQKITQVNDTDLKHMETRLKRIDLEIDNIAHAISQGMFQKVMVEKMNKLEESKTLLQAEIDKRHQLNAAPVVTEEQIQAAVNGFEEFIKSNLSLPEARRFIQQYIKRVDVYKDYVKATFTVAFTIESVSSPALKIEMTATRDEISERKRRKKSFAVVSKEHDLKRLVTEIVTTENAYIQYPNLP